jgi:hypothetical protein
MDFVSFIPLLSLSHIIYALFATCLQTQRWSWRLISAQRVAAWVPETDFWSFGIIVSAKLLRNQNKIALLKLHYVGVTSNHFCAIFTNSLPRPSMSLWIIKLLLYNSKKQDKRRNEFWENVIIAPFVENALFLLSELAKYEPLQFCRCRFVLHFANHFGISTIKIINVTPQSLKPRVLQVIVTINGKDRLVVRLTCSGQWHFM